MNITSLYFVLFVFLALLVYYLLPPRPQNYWLLFLSYVFCTSWSWQFTLILILVTAVNFVLAPRLRIDKQKQKPILWLGISLNVLALLIFRTANFFLPQALSLLGAWGISTQTAVLQFLIPVGLSYYVLENISYLVDVYRGQIKASNNLVDYALYQAYFPKLLAGPIERAGRFLPLLAQQRLVDNEILARSFTLIIIGALRKVIIADSLTASIPADVFSPPNGLSAYELWGWLIVYGFALYNDFAGYTSIVRGVSGLFGIELSSNFQQPYFARNFGEFWNSWHITLSHWLRDYIYFPTLRGLLRRNRNQYSVPNIVIPPLLTMLVSGLWHGLNLQMIVWGGLHGLYQIGERILALRKTADPAEQRPWWYQLLSMAIVFVLVMWAWVPFRLEMPLAIQFWWQLLSFGSFGLQHKRLILAFGYVGLTVGIDILQYRYQDEVIFLRWPRLVQAAALAAVLFLLLIISTGTTAEPFVYQGF